MTYDYGPYYSPEKHGLEVVGSVDYLSGSYEFDLLVVWKDAEGQLYYDTDSGCSCPSPFEGVRRDDLTKATKHEAVAAILKRLDEVKNQGWGFYQSTETEAMDLIERLVTS